MTTFPTIERIADRLAVVTLTEPLDANAAATLRGTLVTLTAEGRRYVALDLTAVREGTGGGIADLAHQADKLKAEGGEMYLIHPAAQVREAVNARPFRDREVWDRFGGIAATPKPHPVSYADPERVLRDAETHYGVPLVVIGEEGEWGFTLGHHEPRRFLAALLAHVRTTCGCDPSDVGLDSVDDLTAFGEKARGYSVIFEHASAAEAGGSAPGGQDWCVCDEGGWWMHEAAADDEHAVPTMTYWIGG